MIEPLTSLIERLLRKSQVMLAQREVQPASEERNERGQTRREYFFDPDGDGEP